MEDCMLILLQCFFFGMSFVKFVVICSLIQNLLFYSKIRKKISKLINTKYLLTYKNAEKEKLNKYLIK